MNVTFCLPILFITIKNELFFSDYICSCKAGRKQTGCCVHIAAFIYYLSFARFREIKVPGEYLSEVLIDMSKKQAPNYPHFIKNKRMKKKDATTTTDSASTFFISATTKLTSSVSNTSITSSTTTNISASTSLSLLDSISSNNPALTSTSSFQEFQAHIPKWSAEITYKGINNIKVVNTCTIDYFLLALWSLESRHSFLKNLTLLEPTAILKEIIANIDKLNWNRARELWIVDIMKYAKNPTSSSISLFGSEYEMFVKYLLIYQIHDAVQICDHTCLFSNKIISRAREILMLTKKNNQVMLNTFYSKTCKRCKKEIKLEFQFVNNPNILFVDSPGNLFIDEIPENIVIGINNFRLFCTTLHKRNHFIGIFEFEGQKYTVDDLHKDALLLPALNSSINRSGYYNIFTGTSLYYKT